MSHANGQNNGMVVMPNGQLYKVSSKTPATKINVPKCGYPAGADKK